MNLEKVIFGFFVVLAATLNFGFVVGEMDNVSQHSPYALFAAIAIVPKGATIIVDATCAQHITVC